MIGNHWILWVATSRPGEYVEFVNPHCSSTALVFWRDRLAEATRGRSVPDASVACPLTADICDPGHTYIRS